STAALSRTSSRRVAIPFPLSVARFFASTSVAITSAPSAAKASVVARPMPAAAAVINAFLPANLPLIRVLLPGRCCGGATLPRGSGGRQAGNNGRAAIQDVGNDLDDAGAMQGASLDLAQGLKALIVGVGLSRPRAGTRPAPTISGSRRKQRITMAKSVRTKQEHRPPATRFQPPRSPLVDALQVAVGIARHHRAAGDEEDGARDPLRLVGGEIDGGAGDVFGLADAAQRVEDGALPAVRLGGEPGRGQRRLDHRRGDGVDADAELAELDRHGLDDVVDRRLAGAVDPLAARRRVEAVDRTQEDDGPALARSAHRPRRRLGAEDLRLQIEAE